MKRFTIIGTLLLFAALSVKAQETDFPKLKGPYLGQKPVGMTPEIFAPNLLSKALGLSFTPDGNELYYTSRSRVMFMRRENNQWTKPQIAPFSGKYRDWDLNLSPDGKKLFFTSKRPGKKDGELPDHADIWVVSRTETGWSEPENIGFPVNTERNELHPTVSSNGNLYYFSDLEDVAGSADIYCSKFIDNNYTTPEKLGIEINSESSDLDPFVAPDESYLIFHSYRQGGHGEADLYISFREKDGSWAQAINMGDKINTEDHDYCGRVSHDGKYLFFKRLKMEPRKSNIYWVDAKIIEEFRNHKQEIHQAAKEGKFDAVKKMLKEDPDLVNAIDSDGLTPLHLAAEYGHRQIVELLLQEGADINAKSGFKRTPLHFAASSGHDEIVSLFIEKGAELNKNDSFVLTPIFQAAYNGHKNIVEMLLSNGINLNATEKNSVTLLHAAAISGNPELVEMLLDKGIDRNVRNIFGKTPLHFAASRGHNAAVKTLIDRGADINIKSLDGRTPLQTAIDCDQKETADLLKVKGADSGPRHFIVPEGRYFGQKPPGLEPEIFAPGIISTDGYEFAITFSPGGKELYFTRAGGEKNYPTNYLMVCRYEDNRWTEPEIASFSGEYFDFESHISPNGNRLYFGSQRPKPQGIKAEGDIWLLEKTDHGWGEPKFLDAPVNNGFAMYVTSAKNGNLYYTGVDGLYRSIYKNGKYSEPEKLKDENGEYFSGAHPFIAPDESYLIFDSGPGLMISFQTKDGTWTNAKKMGIIPNMCPSVSPDGKYLFFARHGNIVWVDAKIIEILKPKNLK